jgi:hypothetical protein
MRGPVRPRPSDQAKVMIREVVVVKSHWSRLYIRRHGHHHHHPIHHHYYLGRPRWTRQIFRSVPWRSATRGGRSRETRSEGSASSVQVDTTVAAAAAAAAAVTTYHLVVAAKRRRMKQEQLVPLLSNPHPALLTASVSC